MTRQNTTASLSIGDRIGSRVTYWHLSGITLASTYVLMLLGAYTSAIGGGLACPDWPTCYGTYFPFLHPGRFADAPWTFEQIFAEWAHRTWAAAVGPLILATAVGAWTVHRDDPIVRWSATAALALLPLQVILGGLTVTQKLEPFIVTSHLGTAILILLALAVTTLAAWMNDRNG